MSDIARNLQSVRERIEGACVKAGRSIETVTLVCVTKTFPADLVQLAIDAGATDLGENYVQEASDKIEALGRKPRWHMIGRLQSNKAAKAAALFDMVQSVDSLKLATRLSAAAGEIGKTLDVLLEVNVGLEETKGGVTSETAVDFAGQIAQLPALRLCGVMGIPPFDSSPDELRAHFRTLRSVFESLPDDNRKVLSMGMSGDFEMAIEEGSTMVRVGSAIFGARSRPLKS